MTQTKRSIQLTALLAVGLALTFLLTLPSAAVAKIYKWVDDSGITHHTDDLSKIPRQYRLRDRIKTIRKVAPKSNAKVADPDSQESTGDSGEPTDDAMEESEKDLQAGETPLEDEEEDKLIGLFKETKGFLETNNRRLDQLFKLYPKPNKDGGMFIVFSVKASGKAKKEFASKLNKEKVPKLGPIIAYLSESAAMDELEILKGEFFLPRLNSLYARLKEELTTQKIFIEELDKYLAEFSKG